MTNLSAYYWGNFPWQICIYPFCIYLRMKSYISKLDFSIRVMFMYCILESRVTYIDTYVLYLADNTFCTVQCCSLALREEF